MRYGGLIVLATVASLLMSAVFAEDRPVDLGTMGKETVRQVQSALAEFGYSPGSADGVIGRRTERAISAFRKDTGVGEGHALDPALLLALGVEKPNSAHSAKIFLSIESSQDLGRRLEKLSRDQVLNEVDALASADSRLFDMGLSKRRSIVFVVYSPIEERSIVKTIASNIVAGKKNSWASEFNYPILSDIPTEPLIIINEFETYKSMYLVHELIIDRERVAYRLTRAQ